MVIVHRLHPGGHRYYLAAVGTTAGRGEVPGVWMGAGATAQGLHGQVVGDDLTGLLPRGTGRVPGFDVTFAAPKSVSVLHGLADADVSATVAEAHDAGVAAGLAYLEEQAARVRIGGAWVRADGLVVAGFRHRVSRADDPHLHTHAVVANHGRVDGEPPRAIDSTSLYAERRGAAALYHATLRHHLTRSLGLRWERPAFGVADCGEVPPHVRAAFSQRAAAVRAAAPERADRRWAERATRPARHELVDVPALRAGWRRRAVAIGWVPGRYSGREPVAGRGGRLPEHDRFGYADVLVGVAQGVRDGMAPTEMREVAGALIEAAVQVGPGRYTTTAALVRRSEVDRELGRSDGIDDTFPSLVRLRDTVHARCGRVIVVSADRGTAAEFGDRLGVLAVGVRDAARAIDALGLGPLDAVVIPRADRVESAALGELLEAARHHAFDLIAPDHVRVRDVPVGVEQRSRGVGDDEGRSAVADWVAARRDGRAVALVVPPGEVAAFNVEARAALRAVGLLDQVEVGGVARGDRVRFPAGRPRYGIERNAIAAIESVGADSVVLRIGRREIAMVPRDVGSAVHAHAVPPRLAGRGEAFVVGGHHVGGGPIHRYRTGPELSLDLSHELARDRSPAVLELSI